MSRRFRTVLAVAAVAIAGAWLNTPSTSAPAASTITHEPALPTLGPLQLIMTNYTHSIAASCEFDSGDFTLEWEFEADDIPGVPAGVDIIDAESNNADVEENGPTVELEYEDTGGCNSTAARNFTGTVTGELSNGDTFTITLLGS